MERQRDLELRAVCRFIYRVILTVVARRRFLRAKARIIQVQKLVKVSLVPTVALLIIYNLIIL